MALTSGRNTAEVAKAKLIILPVDAGKIIYEGSLVVLTSAGYAQAATKAADLVAVGRAEERVDNTGGAAGSKQILVRRGVFVWDNSATAENQVQDTDLLKPCYIEDDCTVSMLATGSSPAGVVMGVTEDGVEVETGRANLTIAITQG
ncbi:MAG: hypothetical protein VB085_08780 [Peptococcaceae bacterium]|nr:hypothetical protein [Peptococcaceae bacterium]